MGKNDFTRKCRRCRLYKNRTMVVFGRGDTKADLVLVGEAPGVDEDRVGKPFVGKSGKLLNLMLKAAHLKRRKIFITNVCLCRPPNNRRPLPSEIKACRPRLQKTLGRIGQYCILMGRTASLAVLKSPNCYWGKPYKVPGTKPIKWAIPVKHPAWYLRGNQRYIPFGITEFVTSVETLREFAKGEYEW